MPVTTFNEFLARISAGYEHLIPVWGEATTATVVLGSNTIPIKRIGWASSTPASFPNGVSAFIPSEVYASRSVTDGTLLFAWLINFGDLDIAGPTFTDGSAMPTVLEGNVSRQLDSAVLIEVTTALSSSPGSITVTYVDQDGNTETTAAQSLGASAPVRSSGFILLNPPDRGARDITNATRTGGTTPTGVIRFWGIVPIAFMGISPLNPGGVAYQNLITESFNYLRLGTDATLGVFSFGSTATEAIVGAIKMVGDST
jgi:hypothetical protein